MIKKIVIFIALLQVLCVPIFAQWDIENKVSLFMEEGLYSNWESSGSNFLSTGIFYSGKWNWKSEDSTIHFQNSLEAEIGTMYQTDWKKNTDKILANVSANQQATGNLNYNGTLNYRSTFDPFLAPTILVAIGGMYILPHWTFQINPITERLNFSTSKSTISEFGNYVKITYEGEVWENVDLQGRFEWFYCYGMKIWTESFYDFELRLDGKINKWLSAGVTVQTLFDLKKSKKLQSRERIGLNLTYVL